MFSLPFEHGHLGVVKTAAPVQIDDFSPRFFHGIRIDRPADLELGFLGQLLVAHFLVAQIFHKANHGPLDNLQDDDSACRALLVRRLHIDEPAPRNQLAHVLLHEGGIKRPAHARLQLIENLRGGNGVVADRRGFQPPVHRSRKATGRKLLARAPFCRTSRAASLGTRFPFHPAEKARGTMAVTPTRIANEASAQRRQARWSKLRFPKWCRAISPREEASPIAEKTLGQVHRRPSARRTRCIRAALRQAALRKSRVEIAKSAANHKAGCGWVATGKTISGRACSR